MNNKTRILILIVLAAAILGIVVLKKSASPSSNSLQPVADNNKLVLQDKPLPKLVDLGADKCIPCKMMMPVLEQLKTEFQGRLKVEFLDVWKDPSAARGYNLKVIPTQVFFDPNGKELFRHEGFFSKEEILNKWKELGFDLSGQL